MRELNKILESVKLMNHVVQKLMFSFLWKGPIGIIRLLSAFHSSTLSVVVHSTSFSSLLGKGTCLSEYTLVFAPPHWSLPSPGCLILGYGEQTHWLSHPPEHLIVIQVICLAPYLFFALLLSWFRTLAQRRNAIIRIPLRDPNKLEVIVLAERRNLTACRRLRDKLIYTVEAHKDYECGSIENPCRWEWGWG